MENPDHYYRSLLRRLFSQRFNSTEVKSLCFDYGVDYDSLSGENKIEKVSSVIVWFAQRNRLYNLLSYCKRERPDVDWSEIEKAINNKPDIFLLNQPEKKSLEQFETKEKKVENRYFIGKRIKKLRQERGLTVSQFMEFINCNSQLKLQQIESNELECSPSLINNTSNFTGASLNWLTHGQGSQYEGYRLDYRYPMNFLDHIYDLKPRRIYFCLNTDNLQLYLISQLSSYRYDVYPFSANFDFWLWWDEHSQISRIYHCLTLLLDSFNQRRIPFTGRLFYDHEFKILEKYPEKYLGEVIKKQPLRGQYWVDDLLDIDQKSTMAQNYTTIYGDWFIKVQEYFQDYNNSIPQ